MKAAGDQPENNSKHKIERKFGSGHLCKTQFLLWGYKLKKKKNKTSGLSCIHQIPLLNDLLDHLT